MTVALEPMLARRQLRKSIAADVAALGVAKVISPGTWPTQIEDLPAVLVKAPSARKQSIGRTNVPEFNTTVTVQVEGRLTAATEADAQEALEALEFKVEQAILTGHWTRQIVQQFASVTSDNEVRPEGKVHLAGFRMLIECETFESYDETVVFPDETPWPPDGPTPISDLQGMNLHVDAIEPADPSGTYENPTFPGSVTAAPRTQGPDGRDEGYVQVDGLDS
jgi:hypothetical protein